MRYTSPKSEKACFLMLQERRDVVVPATQQSDDIARRAIPELQPNNFWRRPEKNTHTMKILILADEGHSAISSAIPDRSIGCAKQTHFRQMSRLGIDISQCCDKTCG
jgi:hypothetical protein